MKNLYLKTKKLAALFTAISLCLTPPTPISFAAPVIPVPVSPAFNYLQNIPRDLATLQKGANFSERVEAPFILHIQDAHTNPSAQQNIKNILTWVVENHPGRIIVGVEGAKGRLHPEYLDFFRHNPKANEAVIKSLSEKGELNGVELFAHKHQTLLEKKVIIRGIENAGLYRRNLSLYHEILSQSGELGARLTLLKQPLEKLQNQIFSKELSAFLQQRDRRKEGKYNDREQTPQLEVYLRFLRQSAKKHLSINLDESIEQIRFPQLFALIALEKLSAGFDQAKASEEKDVFVKSLRVSAASKKDLEILTDFSAIESSTNPREIVEAVWDLCGRKGLDLKKHPLLIQSLGLMILSSEINISQLFEEFSRVESLLIKKLARSQKEKTLVDILSRLTLTEKFLSAEITRPEWVEIERTRKHLPSAIVSQAKKLGAKFDVKTSEALNSLDRAYENSKRFYKLARTRDRVLLTNTLKAARNAGNSDGTLIVLVTGGFHTPGLTSAMQGYGIPYAVAQPMAATDTPKSLLVNVYQNENIGGLPSLDTPITKQQALFLTEIFKTGTDYFSSEKHLSAPDLNQTLADAVNSHPALRGLELKPSPARNGEKNSKNGKPGLSANVHAIAEVSATSDFEVYPRLRGTHTWSRPLRGNSPGRGFKSLPIFNSMTLRAKRSEVRIPHAKGKKVAVTGFRGTGRSTALMLTEMGHNVTVVDSPEIIQMVTPEWDSFFSRFNQADNFLLIDRLSIESAVKVRDDPDKITERENAFFKVVSENDVIFLDSGLEIGSDYMLYREHLLGQAMDFGNALGKLRREESQHGRRHAAKVFVVRASVDVETTEKVYNTIKWHMKSDDLEKINLDVVYQPDFINYDSNTLREPYVMFGIRSALGTREHQQTEAMLRALYADSVAGTRLDFVDLRSAVLAEDDLIIYLATKLAFFNDLAELSDRFDADLSIVAKGAGLDRRIRALFANPSLAFGGRLLVLLHWIERQRLNRLAGRNIGKRKYTSLEIDELLKSKTEEIQTGTQSMESVIDSLPKEFRLLFWIKLIRSINQNNELQFLENKILNHFKADTLRMKKVALLGVGYSRKSGRIIESPALNLIERLVKDKHVNEFYIVDPRAREDFKEWLDEQRRQSDLYRSVIFHGIDAREVTDLYEAVAKSDLSIIATDSNPDIFHLDLEKLKKSLRDTPLFDGINLFGIRANGELANGMSDYKLDNIRKIGINYVSVGRPDIIPSTDSHSTRYLTDSKIYSGLDDYPIKLFSESQFVNLAMERLIAQSAGPEQVQAINFDREVKRKRIETREDLLVEISLPGYLDIKAKLESILTDLDLENFQLMEVTIIGGGYVGLTTGGNTSTLGLEKSSKGHKVHVVDVLEAQSRIDGLNSEATVVPIYEPAGPKAKLGLQDLIIEGKKQGTIDFSTEKNIPVTRSLINILAVGTPQKDDGEIDLSQILNSASEIGVIINDLKYKMPPPLASGIPGHFKIITIKSTVTPDTFEKIIHRLSGLNLAIGKDYALASMPEFLKEGSAVDDVRFPDRTVIGIYSGMPDRIRRFTELALLKLIYPLMRHHPHPVIVTDTSTSTLIKYAANSLLAVSISLSNIFAQEAEFAEADYFAIRTALAADERISDDAFLSPGCGYGGSCFPKDVRALHTLSIAEVNAVGLRLIQAADTLNGYFQDEVADKVIRGLSRHTDAQAPIRGKSIAIWGLTFKPKTDDVREAPSARITARLIQKGASHVTLHDPIFNVQPHLRENVENRFIEELEKNFIKMKLFTLADGDFKSWFRQNFIATGKIRFTATKEDALVVPSTNGDTTAVDTLVLATDWPEYKDVDFSQLSPQGKPLFLLDARNRWRDLKSREKIAAAGNITYQGIGTLRILSAGISARSEARIDFGDDSLTTSELVARMTASQTALPSIANRFGSLRNVASAVTAFSFGDLSRRFDSADQTLQFIRWVWGSNAPASTSGKNLILELAKEILGPEYFDLLFKLSGPSIHLIAPAIGNKIPVGTLLYLAAAEKDDLITYITVGTREEARAVEAAFEDRALKLGLPVTSVRSNFSVTASPSTRANVTTVKRVGGQDRTRRVGFMNPELNFLALIGYIQNTYRLHTENLSLDDAISFAALVLKSPLPDAFSIKNIRKELEARNLSVDIFVERMGRLIEAIRHLDTQA